MKSIEIHLIQSAPINCFNRGEDNSPKTAYFGGVKRARISSQCQKAAVRSYCKETDHKFFQGLRTRWLAPLLSEKMKELGIEEEMANKLTSEIVAELVKNDDKTNEEGDSQSKTLMFITPLEITAIAEKMKELLTSGKAASKKKAKGEEGTIFSAKELALALKGVGLVDGADIALHGRMVASNPAMNVEGAVCVGHALSIHAVENDTDFFSAIDDKQEEGQSGAAMMDNLEFNSACYYRTFNLNLGLFAETLKKLPVEERKEIIRCYIKSWLIALPTARKNSMFAMSNPSYAMAIVRNQGHPLSFANAFEKAVPSSKDGYVGQAIVQLKKHAEEQMQWASAGDIERVLEIPGMNIDQFCTELSNHVI